MFIWNRSRSNGGTKAMAWNTSDQSHEWSREFIFSYLFLSFYKTMPHGNDICYCGTNSLHRNNNSDDVNCDYEDLRCFYDKLEKMVWVKLIINRSKNGQVGNFLLLSFTEWEGQQKVSTLRCQRNTCPQDASCFSVVPNRLHKMKPTNVCKP